jgi:hypothetical protein
MDEVIKTGTNTLTVPERGGVIVNNWGQTTGGVTHNLGTASSSGQSVMVVCGYSSTAGVKVIFGTANRFWIDGSAGTYGGTVGMGTASRGAALSMVSFTTGTGSTAGTEIGWLVTTLAGTWGVQ